MKIRVYYEDTDAAGVVYHANYLNFMERARTEFLREQGLSVAALAADGAVFPVVRMEIDFKSPARHDELLQVTTVPLKLTGSTFTLQQQILRTTDNLLLVQAIVTLACIGPNHKARRIPAEVREFLAQGVQP